ncbi:hypothetical protein [Gimesia algae]|uniref:Uncharacterized protein n=1 Tax=Gimesia algae TaxID=2527971 RepID=A0A517VMS5_9PLAN|nr:hypothetical protein [Gimesia algae]QDT94312.1 hypothetical protein Pan161_60080 [Gimesia algae]
MLSIMVDLNSKRLIYLKVFLFLVILLFAKGLIIAQAGSWQISLLLQYQISKKQKQLTHRIDFIYLKLLIELLLRTRGTQ